MDNASGGGIGGVCLAIALAGCPDIDLVLYEAASSFKEIGAGVTIWGRAWRVFSLLKVDNALRNLSGVSEDGSEGVDYDYP